MGEVSCKIVKQLVQLPEKSGWRKELNLVSWNEKEPVYDFRAWNEDHTKMGKGITLNEEEFKELQIKIQEDY